MSEGDCTSLYTSQVWILLPRELKAEAILDSSDCLYLSMI